MSMKLDAKMITTRKLPLPQQQRHVQLRLFALGALAILLLWCSTQWTALLRRHELSLSHSSSSSPSFASSSLIPWWQHFGFNATHTPIRPSNGSRSRVQHHDWTITRSDISPDGLTRPMILVNSRFPGPSLVACPGDTLVITVHNHLVLDDRSSFSTWDEKARSRFSTQVDRFYPVGSDDEVSIHWHGLSMRGSPHADGAPGFTSLVIRPGESHTYTFKVQDEDVGTHWWHSHSGMGRSDGLWGTLIVVDEHRSREQRLLETYAAAAAAKTQPVSSSSENAELLTSWQRENVVTVGDHYFAPGIDQISWFLSRHSLGFEPTPDNLLINGRGTFDCHRLLGSDARRYGACLSSSSSSYPKIELEKGKTTRVRLINVGAVAHQTVSLDQHTMTVIEADGALIVPYTTNRLSIAPGQRYSVLIKADRHRKKNTKSHEGKQMQKETQEQSESFWLRTEVDRECFNVPNPNLPAQAKAIVVYCPSTPSSSSSSSSSSCASSSSSGDGSGSGQGRPKDSPSDLLFGDDFDLELRSRGRSTLARTASAAVAAAPVVLPSSLPWPRGGGSNAEERPCHDEPPQLLRPLRVSPDSNSASAPLAPELKLQGGDRQFTLTLTMPKLDRNGLVPVGWVNRTQWRKPEVPLLRSFAELDPSFVRTSGAGARRWDQHHQTVLIASSSIPNKTTTTVVEVIINNHDEAPHPFHLHGHKFHLMAISQSAVGFGSYIPPSSSTTTEEEEEEEANGDMISFSRETAPWRDTVSIPRRGFVKLRWTADNPGVWALHCHVLVHMVSGMAAAIVELPESLPRLAEQPPGRDDSTSR